tara:strand:+ start:550 stop:960 length:411 start_codon:yes stop_codon:yes gene_type:complete
MVINYEANKSPLEAIVEKATNILDVTQPEQVTDAMSDYSRALLVLKETDDFRLTPLKHSLKRLYVYPTRKEHNEFVKDIHKLREELREDRIDKILEEQTRKELGEESSTAATKKMPRWPLIAFVIILLYVYTKRAT